MAGKAGLKAGLIGAAVMLVMTLLSQIPGVGCVCCGLNLLVYAVIGALAGFFLTPPRTAGTGAGAGAIAGLVSGAVSGVVSIIIMAIQMVRAGSGEIISYLDPQQIQQLIELGIDPEVFGILSGAGGVAIGGSLCCLAGLVIGAGIGAAGGAIFAAVKSD
ncbi:MAG: hypothetical protein V3T90_00860 [Anaerolineae bacterium]